MATPNLGIPVPHNQRSIIIHFIISSNAMLTSGTTTSSSVASTTLTSSSSQSSLVNTTITATAGVLAHLPNSNRSVEYKVVITRTLVFKVRNHRTFPHFEKSGKKHEDITYTVTKKVRQTSWTPIFLQFGGGDITFLFLPVGFGLIIIICE